MDGPIMWNLDYQIFGDTIKVYMNDSTIDWAHIPDFAFATQQKDTAFFDQLSGKDLKAYFVNGDISQVDVSGNVQTIFYPQESDMTFTGMNMAETSFLYHVYEKPTNGQIENVADRGRNDDPDFQAETRYDISARLQVV